jgi:hypothetical protein
VLSDHLFDTAFRTLTHLVNTMLDTAGLSNAWWGEAILTASHVCCMDLPGPTISVGTRTDYSVGPWDYSTCAARHLMVWSTKTTEEKYSDRKLYKSHTV